MRNTVRNIFLSGIILLCLCGTALSADLFQDLKKAVEQQGSQKKTEPGNLSQALTAVSI